MGFRFFRAWGTRIAYLILGVNTSAYAISSAVPNPSTFCNRFYAQLDQLSPEDIARFIQPPGSIEDVVALRSNPLAWQYMAFAHKDIFVPQWHPVLAKAMDATEPGLCLSMCLSEVINIVRAVTGSMPAHWDATRLKSSTLENLSSIQMQHFLKFNKEIADGMNYNEAYLHLQKLLKDRGLLKDVRLEVQFASQIIDKRKSLPHSRIWVASLRKFEDREFGHSIIILHIDSKNKFLFYSDPNSPNVIRKVSFSTLNYNAINVLVIQTEKSGANIPATYIPFGISIELKPPPAF